MLLSHPLDRLAVAAVVAYQRWISPRKGFACAHRLRHGGPSCSEFVKQRIAHEGLRAALASLRPRLDSCRAASLPLAASRPTRPDHAEPADPDADEKKKDEKARSLVAAGPCLYVPFFDCSGPSSATDGADAGGCDLPGFDGCSCDLGG